MNGHRVAHGDSPVGRWAGYELLGGRVLYLCRTDRGILKVESKRAITPSEVGPLIRRFEQLYREAGE